MKTITLQNTLQIGVIFLLFILFTPTLNIAQVPIDTIFIDPNLGLTNNQLNGKTDIRTTSSGEIWIALSSAGLVHFDGNIWSIINNLNSGGQLPTNGLTQLHVDVSSNLWIGSSYGITLKSSGNYTSYAFNSSPNFPNSHINAITSNSQNVFVGTNIGLSILNLSNQTWSRFTSANSTLLNDSIKSLTTDPSGKVWIGTGNGYAIYNNGILTTYNSSNSSLPANRIQDIAVTPFDTLFIAENYGLIRLNANNYTWIDSTYFGMLTASFCNSSPYVSIERDQTYPGYYSRFAIDNNNRINTIVVNSYFNTSTKLLCIYPNHLMHSTTIPQGYSNFLNKAFLSNFKNDSLLYTQNPLYLINVENSNAGNYPLLNPAINPSTNSGSFPIDIPASYIAGDRAILEANMISAGILNRGDLHWDFMSQTPIYQVPLTSAKNTVYASSIWLGGIDSTGLIYSAAQTYRQSGRDFFPGPLDANGTIDSTTTKAFDHIWMARRSDINEFRYQFAIGNVQNGTYTIPAFILAWPAQYNNPAYPQRLAPYIDMNGDNMYDPLVGDYPDVKGDQMAWWIFNDAFGTKTKSGSATMGLEVQGSAFAINCDDNTNTGLALSYTTFYHYEVYNRSAKDYHDFYFGMWSDFDLGNPSDDYVGCDVGNNTFYVYNGDSVDDGVQGYGACPPIQNVCFLKGPLANPGDNLDNNNDGITDEPNEDYGLSGFTYYTNTNNIPTGNPEVTNDYYEYLSGKWLDGIPITYGGDGRGGGTNPTTIPTHLMFPDNSDPAFTTQWTMGSAGILPDERRGVGSYGPMNLPAGSMLSFDIAFITGPTDFTQNHNLVNDVRNSFNNAQFSNFSGNLPAIQGSSISPALSSSVYSVPLPNFAANNFIWTVQNGTIVNGQGTNTITVLWGTTGMGYVNLELLQNTNPCKQETGLNVTVGNVGIPESIKTNDFRIYPNPTHNVLNIETNGEKINSIRIRNLQGQIISLNSFNGMINTDQLVSGVYLLELLNNQQQVKLKKLFVKE